jgi:hypothetical protein
MTRNIILQNKWRTSTYALSHYPANAYASELEVSVFPFTNKKQQVTISASRLKELFSLREIVIAGLEEGKDFQYNLGGGLVVKHELAYRNLAVRFFDGLKATMHGVNLNYGEAEVFMEEVLPTVASIMTLEDVVSCRERCSKMAPNILMGCAECTPPVSSTEYRRTFKK